ncbi:MAG: hypothetical protein JOZ05_12940, partial [Acetobacteraceae bacterium]|nr:hypothetical protein [Acetobacteraceae bacterium]
MAPRDPTIALALATACLGPDDKRAEALFAKLVEEHDVREAWLGLATARRRLRDAAGAAAALAEARQRHAMDADFAAVAQAVARDLGWQHPIPHAPSRPRRQAVCATVGCVGAQHGGLVGWAWHPGDPDRDPVLTIRPVKGGGRMTVTAKDRTAKVEGLLARPRG